MLDAGLAGVGRIRGLFSAVADVLFPQLCVFCKGEWVSGGMYLCATCRDAIVQIEHPYCHRCGAPADIDYPHAEFECGFCRKGEYEFDRARSFGVYESVLRELILHFKYRGHPGVMKELRPMLESYCRGLEEVFSGFIVVPVPLHYSKLARRGFDQAYLLAREMADILDLPLREGSLIRTVAQDPQAGRARAERKKNIRGVFSVPCPGDVTGKNILLVDDVMTTAATVDEASRTLRNAGAGRVDAFTLARA